MGENEPNQFRFEGSRRTGNSPDPAANGIASLEVTKGHGLVKWLFSMEWWDILALAIFCIAATACFISVLAMFGVLFDCACSPT